MTTDKELSDLLLSGQFKVEQRGGEDYSAALLRTALEECKRRIELFELARELRNSLVAARDFIYSGNSGWFPQKWRDAIDKFDRDYSLYRPETDRNFELEIEPNGKEQKIGAAMSEKQSAEIPELTKPVRCGTCGAWQAERNEWQWKYCKFKRSQDIEEIRNLLKVTDRSQRYSEIRCDLLESYLSEILENRERIVALDAIRRDLMHALERRRENHDHCVVRPEGDRRCKNCLYDDALLARAREFDKE